MDTKTQAELRFVQGCFLISALALIFPLILWGIRSEVFSLKRWIVVIVASLIISTGFVVGLKWSNFRHGTEVPHFLSPVIINWSDPTPISAGTPLSQVQLNAKSGVDAVPVYSPDIGAVLPIGRHALTVTFMPKNTQDYGTASKTVYLVVNAVTKAPSAPLRVKESLKSALTFNAMADGFRNEPERTRVTETTDGKPWNEDRYSDVRLSINNSLAFPLQNLDLTVEVADDDKQSALAAIGQISDIGGVEFRKPPLPNVIVRLKGLDGKTYSDPVYDNIAHMARPFVLSYTITCPRFRAGEELRLIIGTIRPKRPVPSPPKALHIKGTYETTPSEGSIRGNVDQIVEIPK